MRLSQTKSLGVVAEGGAADVVVDGGPVKETRTLARMSLLLMSLLVMVPRLAGKRNLASVLTTITKTMMK